MSQKEKENSAQEIEAIIKRCMQEQQVKLLQAADSNAQKIVEAKMQNQDEKLKKLESVKLKSPANQKQLDFETQVLKMWDNTELALNNGDQETAKKCVKEGKKLVLSRTKLIRLADREGWATALAYETDDLASDSEDEKRISKAIKSANTKLKRLPKKRTDQNNSENLENSKKQRFEKQTRDWDNVLCWRCGKRGHYMSRCPMSENVFFPSTKNVTNSSTNGKLDDTNDN